MMMMMMMKINPQLNLVTFSDGSQMVTGTNKVAHTPVQRRYPKSVLTALTCNYLTGLVVLAAALAVKAAVLLFPALPASLYRLALPVVSEDSNHPSIILAWHIHKVVLVLSPVISLYHLYTTLAIFKEILVLSQKFPTKK